jgi:hypothetical protein
MTRAKAPAAETNTAAEESTTVETKTAGRTKITDPKQKLLSIIDKPLSPKQAGFVEWVRDLTDGAIEIDAQTLYVVHATYSPFWRQSSEYAAIAAEVAANQQERTASKSIEALQSKSPEDKRKALEAAQAAAERAQERAAKIQAMLADLDDEDSDNDEDDEQF